MVGWVVEVKPGWDECRSYTFLDGPGQTGGRRQGPDPGSSKANRLLDDPR